MLMVARSYSIAEAEEEAMERDDSQAALVGVP